MNTTDKKIRKTKKYSLNDQVVVYKSVLVMPTYPRISTICDQAGLFEQYEKRGGHR